MYAADAAVSLAATRYQRQRTREALIRLLGLRPYQQASFKLPKRLPALPKAPRAVNDINTQLVTARLDVKLSALALKHAAKSPRVGRYHEFH